jgi:hypothetical protein
MSLACMIRGEMPLLAGWQSFRERLCTVDARRRSLTAMRKRAKAADGDEGEGGEGGEAGEAGGTPQQRLLQQHGGDLNAASSAAWKALTEDERTDFKRRAGEANAARRGATAHGCVDLTCRADRSAAAPLHVAAHAPVVAAAPLQLGLHGVAAADRGLLRSSAAGVHDASDPPEPLDDGLVSIAAAQLSPAPPPPPHAQLPLAGLPQPEPLDVHRGIRDTSGGKHLTNSTSLSAGVPTWQCDSEPPGAADAG